VASIPEEKFIQIRFYSPMALNSIKNILKNFAGRRCQMALIHCIECGEKVSDSAPACPKCGYPLAELLSKKKKGNARTPATEGKRGVALIWILVVIGVFGLVGGIALIYDSKELIYEGMHRELTRTYHYGRLGAGVVLCVVGFVAEIAALVIFLYRRTP
jgi:hypothetical protein